MGKTKKIYDILKCKNYDIPLNDLDAWSFYPNHNWVYNRLELAKYQGIKCAPMPIQPKDNIYPIIIKPIINLYGMGNKIIKVNNYDEFEKEWYKNNTDFWSEFLTGTHKSWDFVINRGKILYHTCFIGHNCSETVGKFTLWESVNNNIPKNIKKFIKKEFTTYIGCVNIETISNKMIECHLRMGDIDKFPTLKILKGIIKNYDNKKYKNWSKIKYQQIYMFPIWFPNPSKEIYKHARNFKYKKVLEYEIDEDYLCKPGESDERRIMWFTCMDYKFGKEMRDTLLGELLFY